MKKHFILTPLLVLLFVSYAECRRNNDRILSRKRRYLTFPEGSSITIAVCMTAQTGVIPPGIFSESIAWGLAYELPNDTKQFKDVYTDKNLLKRRHRRDLYGKMETIIDSMGYDGRSCVLRTLCEANYRLLPREDSLLKYILKIVFGFPDQPVLPSEPDEHRIYHWAYERGKETQQCSDVFTQCPFSLIDMALGYYSQFAT